MTDGSFYKAPKWVDLKKQPGTTSQPVLPWSTWAVKSFTGQSLIFSPNFVWFSVAILNYCIIGLDLEKAKTFQLDWIQQRILINLAIVFAYYGYWHGTLYYARWSQRKFSAQTFPSSSNMMHNVWYTSLGTVQYSFWEVCFMYAYANNKLSFISNKELLESPTAMVSTLMWCVLIPVWRGLHFYFAHRLIHIKALYKWVHSLHHRNGDIEPFAGMCMHPVEHLYYFSCLAPSLYFRMSPLIMIWNGMHLILSPACSHSGWEDHFQSDQFHYLHHARFECNYGSASLPLDHWFGTFRDKMGESKSYTGEVKSEIKASPFKIQSSTLFSVYFLLITMVFVAFGYTAFTPTSTLAAYPFFTSALLAFGPVVIAFLLFFVSGDKQSMLWPFQNEPIIGGLHKSLGFNATVGFLVAVVPVYHLALAVLGDCAACA